MSEAEEASIPVAAPPMLSASTATEVFACNALNSAAVAPTSLITKENLLREDLEELLVDIAVKLAIVVSVTVACIYVASTASREVACVCDIAPLIITWLPEL